MISFHPLKQEDLALMHTWFNQPHVQEFYSLRSWKEQEVLDKIKPSLTHEKQIFGYIIRLGDSAIGYIQWYPVEQHPWPEQELERGIVSQAAGVDLFIGDAGWVHKGLGREIMQTFLDKVIWPRFSYCLVDPDIRNTSSIRMFQKCGFAMHKTVEASDKLGKPSNLCLMIKSKTQ